ncbi:indole acetimide hydrolase [Solihabitans fulvus]|uniref:Indole acetimide hydrolase n=1 Tax=Solihabitans fulvus TaxID=1892852 RepID=A0A5B2XPK7_9PSEU|nr:amidase [Solihabitans fulvus]KAA2265677.1 indole acetimide hydrolase [Solihabitans fulvus]
MGTELWQLSATALASAIARGEAGAMEVLNAHLARIEEVNPVANAVTAVLADSARLAARDIDRRRAAGEVLGPLAGVPVTVKDNIHVAGSATTLGVPRFRDLVAAEDAPPVRRLRRAGAIPIGRTNMPDLTMGGMHTVSTLHGDTRNPWDPARTPGGTSGGDGVAVATGMTPLGLGNDSGGSVRVPAAFNGVAGLKPSYGRFAADHRLGDQDPTLSSQLFPVDGPLARTVADLALVHRVLAGPDPQDPRAVPVPLEGPPLPHPIRVGVAADPGGHGTHPHVLAGVEAAADALRDAGYLVEEVEVPRLQDAVDGYTGLIYTEFSLVWPMVSGLLTEESRRHVEFSMRQYPPVGLAEYLGLTARRLGIQRDWARFFADIPLLLGPVSTQPPAPPATMHSDVEANAATMGTVRLCRASTFVGVPAVAVPVGVADGLPLGVQVIGGMYREDLCLEAAAAIESRLGVLTPIDPRTNR